MEFKIRPARLEDADSLTPRLRDSDILEIHRSSYGPVDDALLQSIRYSDPDMCWAATLDGQVEVLFGANALQAGLGGIWMLGSDRIYDAPRSFLKHCKSYLRFMHTRYPYLTNFVDVEHTSANKWMRRLGFQAVQFIPDHGPMGHPFIQYISERAHV